MHSQSESRPEKLQRKLVKGYFGLVFTPNIWVRENKEVKNF